MRAERPVTRALRNSSRVRTVSGSEQERHRLPVVGRGVIEGDLARTGNAAACLPDWA